MPAGWLSVIIVLVLLSGLGLRNFSKVNAEPTPESQASKTSEERSPLSATLPSGVKLELLGVSPWPCRECTW